jgi:hypothetical protein
MNNNTLFTYYYSVPDKNGYPVSKYSLVSYDEFVQLTHMDPITGNYIIM